VSDGDNGEAFSDGYRVIHPFLEETGDILGTSSWRAWDASSKNNKENAAMISAC
jgi:hypothetical protein